jgi:hypothetical protein
VRLDADGGWVLTLEGHNDISRSSSVVRIIGVAFGGKARSIRLGELYR